MAYNIKSLLLEIICIISCILLLNTSPALAQELPSLPTLDELTLPELDMIQAGDDSLTVSRPQTTPQQSFDTKLPDIEDTNNADNQNNLEDDSLAFPGTEEASLPQLPPLENTAPREEGEDSGNSESWVDKMKELVGLGNEDNKDEPTTSSAENDDISQTMSEIDQMIGKGNISETSAPAETQDQNIQQDALDQILAAPDLDDLIAEPAPSAPKAPAAPNAPAAPSVTNNTENSLSLPIDDAQPPAAIDGDDIVIQSNDVPSGELELALPALDLSPPAMGDTMQTDATPAESEEESWSDMFARWWFNFKLFIGLAEEETEETDMGPAPAEYADKNLDLFAEPDQTTPTQLLQEIPPLPDDSPKTEELVLDENALDITASEPATPHDNQLLQQQTIEQPDNTSIEKTEKEQEEDLLAKLQQRFTEKEVIVLLMRNDDVVMGQLTQDAKYHYMHPSKYIKLLWESYEWAAEEIARSRTYAFVNYYYEAQRKSTMSEKAKQKIIQQYADDILDAAYAGDMSTIRTLLENYPELLDVNDIYGNNLLHIAVYKKHYNIAKFLILNGIEVDPYNEFMETPLDMTTEAGAMARLLHRAL